ncbi:MAG: hypothetical protein EOP47_16530 [Sphingobacteriaceae bacterium]|nr:MAG: hypothetical protein EOP47_16530 [Sphingobacteriaceae bacterium]
MKWYIFKISVVIMLLFMSVQTFAQRKNIVFESTFENAASITKWYEKAFLQLWSGNIVADHVRVGTGALKVQVIRGLDILNGPRAELGMPPATAEAEAWYGFSHFIPKEYTNDPATEVLNQWQAKPDLDLGEAWRSPPLALEIKADRYKIAIRWSDLKITTPESIGVDYLDIAPVEHGVWVDWVFHVKWGSKSGTLQVWKNGKLILDRINKPIGYNDKLYPYFKAGIYKWEWSTIGTKSTSTDRTYYIDEIRIGNSAATYDDVFPGPPAVVKNPTLPIVPNSLKVTKDTDGSYIVNFTALETVAKPSTFILYVSPNNGKEFISAVSNSTISLEKDKKYTLKFQVK